MTSSRRLTFAVITAGQFVVGTTATAAEVSPIAKFSLPIAEINEYLGHSVATDGQRVLLGTGKGTAFLFDPFTKKQLAKLTLPDPRFSTSVALQGNTAVVGTWQCTMIYDLSNLATITSKRLIATDNTSEVLGTSVDISGNTIIVGANGENSKGEFTGAAYLFDGVTGTQLMKLTADNAAAGDNFGVSVAIDGTRAIVGTSKNTDIHNGEVYVFDVHPDVLGSRQIHRYSVSPTSTNRGMYFGYEVDISGDRLAAVESTGLAYSWSTMGSPTALANSQDIRPGNTLAIDGEVTAVGFSRLGLVNFYDASGSYLRSLAAPPGSPIAFGHSVAIDGDLVVVSAPGGAPQNSAVYVYRLQDVIVPEPTAPILVLNLLFTIFVRRPWRRD